jgi:hypothetical protein
MNQIPETSRRAAIEGAFAEIPSRCGPFELRPLSAGSFALLNRLGNPMVTGAATDNDAMFSAVCEYVWIHSAPIQEVIQIVGRSDLSAAAVNEIAFTLTMADIFTFLREYAKTANRISLGMTEEVDTDTPGKPDPAATIHAGSPLSSMPLAEPETQPVNGTSSGTSLLNGPLPTSTPPAAPPVPSSATASIPPILVMVDPETPPPASPPSAPGGPDWVN